MVLRYPEVFKNSNSVPFITVVKNFCRKSVCQAALLPVFDALKVMTEIL